MSGSKGPGAPCWCGCGEVIPTGKRSDARYVDESHAQAFKRAERRLEASRPTSPSDHLDFWAKRRAAKTDRGGAFDFDPVLLALMTTDGDGQPLGYRAKKAHRKSWKEVAEAPHKFTRWRYSERPRPTPADLEARKANTPPQSKGSVSGRNRKKVAVAFSVVALLPKVEPAYWAFARGQTHEEAYVELAAAA